MENSLPFLKVQKFNFETQDLIFEPVLDSNRRIEFRSSAVQYLNVASAFWRVIRTRQEIRHERVFRLMQKLFLFSNC
jgi:hypothetical protein